MATRTVVGLDGRTWAVRRNVERSVPATGDEFEHDVDGGNGAAIVVLAVLALFWVVLVAWALLPGSRVHVPLYLWIGAGLIALFFPVRWWLRRPWTVVAETDGAYDEENKTPAERWTGLIRGSARAGEEMRIVERRLRTSGTPGHADSPLQPVN